MYFINLVMKKFILTFSALFAVIFLMAQNTTPAAAEPSVTSGYNQLATLLIIVTIVLAFVIWGLGQVLIVLGRQLLLKNKNTSKLLSAAIVTILLFASQNSSAQDAGTTGVSKVVPNFWGLSETTFYMFVIVLSVEVIAILFLTFSIRRIYSELIPKKELAAANSSKLNEWWSKLDQKLFTRAIPVEKEADVLLDHNYDGIQELDNALPPWWKYGFYITIVIAFIYLLNFHVFGFGKNPEEEYVAEMGKAQIDKEKYESRNKDKIDEKNVPMADAAGIKMGQVMFEANCVACHLKGGGSQNPVSVGPNLTDDYWIHKGSLNDIYLTIKNGYPDKGMQSWSTKFNAKEISLLASFIKSIKGTNPPNAKLPQGDMYVENVAATVIDSALSVKSDSAAKKF